MAEYLNKEAFKKSVEERYCKPCKTEGKDHNGCWCRACWVDDMLDEVDCFQSSDVAPVVHGRIIESWNTGRSKRKFSCCGTDCTTMTQWMWPKYCPYCGAKIGGESGNDATD